MKTHSILPSKNGENLFILGIPTHIIPQGMERRLQILRMMIFYLNMKILKIETNI